MMGPYFPLGFEGESNGVGRGRGRREDRAVMMEAMDDT